jgi:hypothetical protein
MQKSSDMVDVVTDSKLAADHLGDPWTGPQITVKAERFRPFQQRALQLEPMAPTQAKRPSGCGTCTKPLLPLLPKERFPSANRASRSTDGVSDLDGLLTSGG